MVKVKKFVLESKIHFALGGKRKDFLKFCYILKNEMKCDLIPEEFDNGKESILIDVDGSMISTFSKDGLVFTLIFDEFGSSLWADSGKKEGEVYYDELEKIANEIADRANKKR